MNLLFVNAVRLVIDLDRKPNDSIDCSSVRQAFFEERGKIHARRSINDSEECTWHVPYNPRRDYDDDLSKITLAQLCPDDTTQTVYYLLYGDKWSAHNTVAYSGTDTVINYISRVTSDLARKIESPRGAEFVPNYSENCDPSQKKDVVSGSSVETYFRNQFMEFYIPGFLRLLSTGREGFDQDGRKADGSGDEDLRMLPVRQNHNKDPDSSEVFVSFPTKEKIDYF